VIINTFLISELAFRREICHDDALKGMRGAEDMRLSRVFSVIIGDASLSSLKLPCLAGPSTVGLAAGVNRRYADA